MSTKTKTFLISKDSKKYFPDCVICISKIEIQGEIECCDHSFCHRCILKWSKVQNTCPICKRKFLLITKLLLKFSKKLGSDKKTKKISSNITGTIMSSVNVKNKVRNQGINPQINDLMVRMREITRMLNQSVQNFSNIVSNLNFGLFNITNPVLPMTNFNSILFSQMNLLNFINENNPNSFLTQKRNHQSRE